MEDPVIQTSIADYREYFKRDEVSNSDLSWLKSQISPTDKVGDIMEAYKFGTLVDAIITESFRVNFFKYMVDKEQYSKDDFSKAQKMNNAFMNDPLCLSIYKNSEFQKVMIEPVNFNFNGMEFTLMMRCKWDLWLTLLKMGGDIKSTTATTQEQFEASIRHFDYDRQRALYMTIAKSDTDILIGISKVNFKVFKFYIKRGDHTFQTGMDKLNYLAYKYFLLFGE